MNAGSKPKERLLVFFLMLLALSSISKAEKSDYICAIYFTGIGCPHCAKTDPVILGELPFEKSNLVVIEYEIYRDRENANVMLAYHNAFGTPLGIPLIIFDSNDYIIGDTPILSRIEEKLSSMDSNPCLLLDGKVNFEEIDLSSLPGKPKIWANSRVLWRAGQENVTTDKKTLLRLLLDNLTAVLSEVQYEVASAEPAPLSGSSVDFDSAVIVGDYKLEWRGGPKLESKKMEEGNIISGIKSLPFHSKILLRCILEKDGVAYTGEIYERYKKICENYGFKPITLRRVNDLLNELEDFGFISCEIISRGRYGRTRKIFSAIDSDIKEKVLPLLVDGI